MQFARDSLRIAARFAELWNAARQPRLRRWIVTAPSTLVFVICLHHPAYDIRHCAANCRVLEYTAGAADCFLFGWVYLLGFLHDIVQPDAIRMALIDQLGRSVWLANPLLIYSWRCSLKGRQVRAWQFAIASLAVMSCFLVVPVAPGADQDFGAVLRYRFGYWLWLTSAALMICFAWPAATGCVNGRVKKFGPQVGWWLGSGAERR